MKDKRSIKRDLLSQFRTVMRQDRDTLPIFWLEGYYISGLTRAERKLLAQAVYDLIKIGLVRWGEGTFARELKLTPKGQMLLY